MVNETSRNIVQSPCTEYSRSRRPACIADDVVLGKDVVIYGFANLYGCAIGDGTRIGPFVEIQKNVRIGRLCKIQSHTFICEGVTIEDEVFIGHGVMFINDRWPRATTEGRLQGSGDWQLLETHVGRGATIGSGAIILAGIRIGEKAMIGAGAVVTRDVPPYTVVTGIPARFHELIGVGELQPQVQDRPE